jgi:hypothetical protein
MGPTSGLSPEMSALLARPLARLLRPSPALVLLAALAACGRDRPQAASLAPAQAGGSSSSSASSPAGGSGGGAGSLPAVAHPSGNTAPRSEGARARCEAQINRLQALPPLPGAPGFEAKRAEILGRAKGEAVLFIVPPTGPQELDLRLSLLRRRLERESPYIAVPAVSAALRYTPADARKLLLAQGYVYAESPELAATLVDVLRLSRLFTEPEIFLARGAEVHRLVRDPKTSVYRHADGDQRGDEASLLFGDRVAPSRDELFPFLHRDLTRLAREHAPDQVRVLRLTSEGAVAELRYGERWVRAALADDGAQLSVSCLAPPVDAAAAAEVDLLLAGNTARAAAIEPVREAVRAMVSERLRFDEPLEEVGQQDGSLRPLWRWAYDHGGNSYSFNGIGYPVFDADGRPHPPQVCIDFVLDAFERASGTWFNRRDEPRARLSGKLDLDTSELKNRRSASEVVAFAQANPAMFDVWQLPDEERVPFGRRRDFFAYLAGHADRLHPGDIVIIHGMKSDGEAHWHSFLIDAIDPISAVPHRLAANAGRPRLQSWESVMRSAPLRSVRFVITPRLPWLQTLVPPPGTPMAAR